VTAYIVAGVAAAAALCAAVWPYIPKARSEAEMPDDRAGWVNRLFSLAASADECGEAQVAAAARALIASLVSQQEAPKRGK
jgi:hypothetical protein